MTKRRSSTTGATTGAEIVETETVCDFSSTVRVVLDGNGFPGAFFTGMLFTAGFFAGALFLATFFATAFLAGAFLATFLTAAFFAGAFFAGAFFAGAFFAAAFLATTFFTGFLGMSRTLCLCSHRYQLRHGQFLRIQSSTLRTSRKGR
jgi:uncharacterized protein YjbI with pentapeptide repeats